LFLLFSSFVFWFVLFFTIYSSLRFVLLYDLLFKNKVNKLCRITDIFSFNSKKEKKNHVPLPCKNRYVQNLQLKLKGEEISSKKQEFLVEKKEDTRKQ